MSELFRIFVYSNEKQPMKKKQETFYRLTIKDIANNITEEQPLAYHTESAALNSAYNLLEERGGIGSMMQVNCDYMFWSQDNTLQIDVKPILIYCQLTKLKSAWK